MASDDTLRNGVRMNLAGWLEKLECGGDVEKQHLRKRKFIQKLSHSPVAIATDKANEQHYEVPTEFFTTVLGPRLKYSCCYWPSGVSSLAEAEEASLQDYCQKARLEDGHAVMDLGCGWGSLGLYIAEKFPRCRVTCVSNSSTQRQFIQDSAAKRGLTSRVTVITADANHFDTAERFDRILSIEMFEHMKNYDVLFQRVASWLKPSGLLFVGILSHYKHPYEFKSSPGSDTEWMAKHFFTGGTMPSSDLFLHFQRDLTLEDQWVLNGRHYSRTLEAWLQKLDANKDAVHSILAKAYGSDADQQLFNWRLFFMFCSEVFAYKEGNEWLNTYYLFRKNLHSRL